MFDPWAVATPPFLWLLAFFYDKSLHFTLKSITLYRKPDTQIHERNSRQNSVESPLCIINYKLSWDRN